MNALYFVLFLVAVLLFLASAFNVDARRVNLMALGLAFFASPFMLQALDKL
jgi:hypothetical protein